MSDLAPLEITAQAYAAPVATAGNDGATCAHIARVTGTIKSVSLVPSDTISGAATDHRTVSLINKGIAGSGTKVIATVTFDSGINAPANKQKAITLSSDPADLAVKPGDVLMWVSTHVGDGITDPGGLVTLVVARD